MKTLLLFVLLASTCVAQQLTYLPVECTDPTQVVFDPSMHQQQSVQPVGVVTVTFDIATMYPSGAYNGTFDWGGIQKALDMYSHYWNVRCVRISRGAQWHFVQANYNLGTNVGASTGGNITRISPVFRFYNAVQCGMVTLHENRHTRIRAHTAQNGGLMGPNGGYLLLDTDMPYFAAMQWKSGLRPSQEPNWFKSYLSGSATLSEQEFPLMNVQNVK